MKKMLAALALALTLPTCALGDSEGVIVQSSCNIVQSGDYYLAYCFAQVHNNASTVICLDQGTFDLQSGETLLSTSEVSQIWPYFLSPGEDGLKELAISNAAYLSQWTGNAAMPLPPDTVLFDKLLAERVKTSAYKPKTDTEHPDGRYSRRWQVNW